MNGVGWNGVEVGAVEVYGFSIWSILLYLLRSCVSKRYLKNIHTKEHTIYSRITQMKKAHIIHLFPIHLEYIAK